MKQIKLVIIEDNRVLRDGLVAILEEIDDIKMLASAGSSKAALEVLQLKPQVVLLNRGLQSQNCMQVIKKTKKEAPEARLVVMDLMPGQTEVMELVRAGVSGFILSNATLDDFVMTLRAVAKGEKVLPDHLTNSLFSQIVDNVAKVGKLPPLKQAVKMTRREKEIIALIGQGMSNKEIAQNLNLSTYTIKSHVHNILEKLALHSRLQVAAYSHSQKDPGRKSEG